MGLFTNIPKEDGIDCLEEALLELDNKDIASLMRFILKHNIFTFNSELEDTARYAGLLLAPAFGRGFFCPSGKKRAFYAVLAHFWCPVVTMVTFSGNISNNNQKKNPKNFKKI